MYCKDCKFWSVMHRATYMTQDIGMCKRHSPVAPSDQSYHGGVWPVVSDDNWCGDFEPKVKPQDKKE